MKYVDKTSVYKKSKYKWVKIFLAENQQWSENMINARALNMAESYYDNIVKKDINTI